MLKVETFFFAPIYLVIFILMMDWIWSNRSNIDLRRWLGIENDFILVVLMTIIKLLLSLVPFAFLIFSIGYTDKYFQHK
jgi:hypothetical protein